MQLDALFPEVVDNTMRKALVKCQKSAHYKHELGLAAVGEERIDLHAGAAFATGMEAMRRAYHAQHTDKYEAVRLGVLALHAAYGSFVPPAGSNKSADRMAGALVYYEQQFPLDTDKLMPLLLTDGTPCLEVAGAYELPVLHPITNKRLRYSVRFDMLAFHTDTMKVWVVDEKTTKQMGDKWCNQWPLDSQMTGYCWGARKFLDARGMQSFEVAGAYINGIAIRLRDYETMRIATYRPQWMIDRWHTQLCFDLEAWKTAFVDGVHNYALDHACAYYNNPCEFAPLCTSANPERAIEGNYIVKRWDPLARDSTA